MLLCLYFVTTTGRASLENSAQCLIDNIKENAASWPFWISNHVSKMIFFSFNFSLTLLFHKMDNESSHQFLCQNELPIINYYNYCGWPVQKLKWTSFLLTIISYHTEYVMSHIVLVYYYAFIVSFSAIFNIINPHWCKFDQWICSMGN